MTPTLAGIAGFVALFALLALRMPIGLAMMLVGATGIAILNSTTAAFNILGSFAFSYSAVFTLSVIPLFVLMGAFANVSGMGSDMYRAAHAFVGHMRGGLAAATIIARITAGPAMPAAMPMLRPRVVRLVRRRLLTSARSAIFMSIHP
jgi:TRAP-type mannitol/chloroaromatic compound transport system permease large subunit